MTLKSTIEEDYLAAYKNKNELLVDTLRMLKSSLKNAEIAKKAELDELEVTKIVQKEAKQRREAIAEYEKAGRNELAQKEKSELDALSKYLPQSLSENELEQIIKNTILELNASGSQDIGKVIGAVMQKVAGKAQGGQVSESVRKTLDK